jgi:hypothetical protein
VAMHKQRRRWRNQSLARQGEEKTGCLAWPQRRPFRYSRDAALASGSSRTPGAPRYRSVVHWRHRFPALENGNLCIVFFSKIMKLCVFFARNEAMYCMANKLVASPLGHGALLADYAMH